MNPEQQSNSPVQKPEPGQPVLEKERRAARVLKKVNNNPYIYIFAVITLLVIGVVAFVLVRGGAEPEFVTTELSADELAQLAERGDIENNGRTLAINANTEIDGTLSVKNNLEVVGSLALGGSLTLPDLTVASTTILNAAQVNEDINIGGNAFIQSQLSVQGRINANGGLTVNGELATSSISTSSLIFSGDLDLSRHITTAGSPASASSGGSVGSGGTVSVSGNDIAGTATINTGSGPSAGALITINFTNAYERTPRVLITPVGSATASFDYYISRTSSGFTIFAATPPPASANFSFDYFVIE